MQVRKLLGRPQLMKRAGLFALDGLHLFEEVVASAYQAETVFVSPRFEKHEMSAGILGGIEQRGWTYQRVSDRLMDVLAPTDSPQGILGLFVRKTAPSVSITPSVTKAPPSTGAAGGLAAIVLDGLQDPGNLGAIARTARALGITHLLTTQGTVDPYHVRSLRASSGALLHMILHTAWTTEALLEHARTHNLTLAALVPRDGDWPPTETRTGDACLLILGSEGKGIQTELAQACRHRWTIPMDAGAESLGVAAAGAIAIYAAAGRFGPR